MLGPKNRILRNVGILERTIKAIAESKFREMGLSRGQFLYIVRICENSGINQISISNMLKVDKTSAAKSINKLVENGFIIKERDKNDIRSYLLYPTEKGEKIYNKIIKEENREVDISLLNFKDSDIEMANLLLSKMINNLESTGEKLYVEGEYR